MGTGFYVTPDLILTAYHVVDKANLVEITFYDGTKTFGKVINHDVRLDLALIKAQVAGKPAKIHAGAIKLGETVEAIGHPKGFEFTITRGVVSALRKQSSAAIKSSALVEFVQTDTPISPGNSGGPLFLRDAVIGVNDWVRVDKASQNLNFSVSFNEIRGYLSRFDGFGK
jgi:S1-C subfamily serine protease